MTLTGPVVGARELLDFRGSRPGHPHVNSVIFSQFGLRCHARREAALRLPIGVGHDAGIDPPKLVMKSAEPSVAIVDPLRAAGPAIVRIGVFAVLSRVLDPHRELEYCPVCIGAAPRPSSPDSKIVPLPSLWGR